jgi:hypothetical protein
MEDLKELKKELTLDFQTKKDKWKDYFQGIAKNLMNNYMSLRRVR